MTVLNQTTIPPLMSIAAFCRTFGLDYKTFARMEREGRAPRRISIGRSHRITGPDAAEWLKNLETADIAERDVGA